ncbi:hypothetical protein KEH51_21310 [[Brevibacterium] frigoritolerans]|uniref:Uncharacterized protein n=1 Tax=Peribacillus frigoritolerans TaxID=450367 RepID=A0A941J8E5_9BACI|nr:hypothetical protein [Peribacillus frigoritolerans]
MERKVRDSCGKSVSRETPQAQAEEAPRPPAESECLEWKSTLKFSQPLKKKIKDIQIFFKITDRGEHSDPLLSSTERCDSTP